MTMTPRSDISWINCDSDSPTVRAQLLDTPHSLFPVCRGVLDEVIGVVQAKELLAALDGGEELQAFALRHPAIAVLDTIDVIKVLGVLRKAKGSLVLVVDEYGSVEGLVTPLDILEAIAGEFPDADETPEIVREAGKGYCGPAPAGPVSGQLATERRCRVCDGFRPASGATWKNARSGREPAAWRCVF
jgi:CBS domain containing-hemolysin-like protein